MLTVSSDLQMEPLVLLCYAHHRLLLITYVLNTSVKYIFKSFLKFSSGAEKKTQSVKYFLSCIDCQVDREKHGDGAV